ncbi:hypothetical protein GX50_04570 [[Emmonsia] crescens]|uniref:Uncharacterized protein n=1 Tax=[Emmonsia] crescens TaxID=73230 RepID=A0A2B7ZGB7_9EURO|nr:hypothetical protein GX50_04570 [Emmonsia crescens]
MPSTAIPDFREQLALAPTAPTQTPLQELTCIARALVLHWALQSFVENRRQLFFDVPIPGTLFSPCNSWRTPPQRAILLGIESCAQGPAWKLVKILSRARSHRLCQSY